MTQRPVMIALMPSCVTQGNLVQYGTKPSSANYDAPACVPITFDQKLGYRVCDQCGAAENPPTIRFRICGGCWTTHYCSPECQKIHWQSHKPICQLVVGQLASAKQQAIGPDGSDLQKHLRKFVSLHSALLGWAGFQALQLKRIPANIRHQALLIELSCNNHADPSRRFSVAGTHLVSRSYVTDKDPIVTVDIQRRDERCRHNGGIGTVVILVQCGSVSQIIPVEIDSPSKTSWDMRVDWAEILYHSIESSNKDSEPIAASARE
ncbi:hypothetical protein PILCRDRAFT_802801 [Piloderma croceum F 1598]|uniref:MYND-type domain-containing protein n=1 Tax=Piloderma croceum (strain F 1598) TaxID=765440 RepID=A0A0C3AHP9_PILCF|nr:hypothetical protein PILCRDRAFT_802801 [Piloderma croceum F 1598]